MHDFKVDDLEFVAFDTETTGLHKGSRLVEISGIRFTPTKEVKPHFSTLVNPEIPIPAVASRIHKIHDSMVQDQPLAEEVISGFFQYAKNAILVAHNLKFDLKILQGEMERLGIKIPPIFCVDTLAITRKWIPQLSSYRLSSLAEHLGIPCQNFHRALDDAMVVKEIVERVIQDFVKKNNRLPLLGEILDSHMLVSFPPPHLSLESDS
ncbi:MAG: 3'-5' exonuclease [Planctomycetota bacterium]|nr:MAG: 3'-5' exonuclease [Planctomycetota bacterium]